MLKRIKRSIAILIASAALLAPVAVPVSVSAVASIQDGVCGGAELTTTPTDCATTTGEANTTADTLITTVINIFSLVVGVVAVIMIIVGGFKYITSGGNDSNVSSAKNTILYAVIGLIIVALAQIIVRFVLAKATA